MGLGLRGYQYIEHGERDLAPRHVRMAAAHLGIPESDFYQNMVLDDKTDLLYQKIRNLNDKQQSAFEAMIDAMIKGEKQ